VLGEDAEDMRFEQMTVGPTAVEELV
jgi:hypothetical protein